jgi:hypothetical protein
MVHGCIVPSNLTDTICTLPTIQDLPAGPPAADPNAPALKPAIADDTLQVLRGVDHTDAHLLDEFTSIGNANDGRREYHDLTPDPSPDWALVWAAIIGANKSAQEDLKSIMDEVKAITAEKQSLRDLVNEVNKLAADSVK